LEEENVKNKNYIRELERKVRILQEKSDLHQAEINSVGNENNLYQNYLIEVLGQSGFLVKTVQELERSLASKMSELKSSVSENNQPSQHFANIKDLESQYQEKIKIYKESTDRLLEDLT
jgi:hypothetical protein